MIDTKIDPATASVCSFIWLVCDVVFCAGLCGSMQSVSVDWISFFIAPVLFLDVDYVASSLWLLLFAVLEQKWAEVRSGDIKMDGGM